jgi:8-oxo-dGTP pyrophosphatase MutT (NUDIX family)
MDNQLVKQLPLKLRGGAKTATRAQFAALCWRMENDQLQICLVTSRTRQRWILPKGWPMNKQTPAAAAATEAYEEAGLRGEVQDICLGVYSYTKPNRFNNAAIVALVYPLHVTHIHSAWPEKGERRRKWFTQQKAAKKLTEPALREIVANFNPKLLGR